MLNALLIMLSNLLFLSTQANISAFLRVLEHFSRGIHTTT